MARHTLFLQKKKRQPLAKHSTRRHGWEMTMIAVGLGLVPCHPNLRQLRALGFLNHTGSHLDSLLGTAGCYSTNGLIALNLQEGHILAREERSISIPRPLPTSLLDPPLVATAHLARLIAQRWAIPENHHPILENHHHTLRQMVGHDAPATHALRTRRLKGARRFCTMMTGLARGWHL